MRVDADRRSLVHHGSALCGSPSIASVENGFGNMTRGRTGRHEGAYKITITYRDSIHMDPDPNVRHDGQV